ncbi:MAG: PSD1 and planctomycete cytochrome C domain-containing protein [Verrucomicrobiota bacterium]
MLRTLPAILLTVAISIAEGLAGDVAAPSFQPEQITFFEKEIRPVIAERCYQCHTGAEAKSGLQLTHRAGWLRGTDYRKVVNLEQPEASPVIQSLLQTDDAKFPAMPEKGPALETEQVEKIAQWIAMGLPWPDEPEPYEQRADPLEHWSFQIPEVAPLPESAGHPIDYFLSHARLEQGVEPAEAAHLDDRARRLYLSLTGLPPSFEELERLRRDQRPESEVWMTLVEELLASPHYGERWARHWMDVARYADTKGYEGAGRERRFIYSYTYRDWLIRAFNEDLPLDQFILYQLAADQIVKDWSGPEREHLAAMGFLSLSKNGKTELVVDDRVDTTFRGLMSLTVSCARCHDHKFDPIPTADYYGIYGVFENSRETAQPVIGPEPSGADADAYRARLAEKRAEIEEALRPHLEKAAAEHPDLAGKPTLLEAKIDPEFKKKLRTMRGKLDKFVADSQMEAPRALLLRDRPDPRPTRVMIRGNPGRRGDVAPRRFLSLVDGPDAPEYTVGSGRLDLAHDIVDPGNPLTARSLVNRVWMWHFGEGLVRTIDDFGITGESPDHPELLDWLAVWFVENGWSLKALNRLIVTSATWQQGSAHPNKLEMTELDPENRTLWHFPRRRLDLEQMRDSMLAVSGELDRNLFGHPVEVFGATASNRRTVYAFIDRQNLNPVFRHFDFSNPQETTAQRPRTTIPMQALFTLNSEFSRGRSIALAEQAIATGEPVVAMHRKVFGEEPSGAAIALASSFLDDFERGVAPLRENQTGTAWSYGWGEVSEDLSVAFNRFEHWTGEQWQVQGGDFPIPNSPLSYLRARGGQTHSGYTSREASVIRWEAPADLTVRLEADLTRPNQGKGNGVRLRVIVGSPDGGEWRSLHDVVLPPTEKSKVFNRAELALRAGEIVHFIVDPYKDNSAFDTVTWNIDITELGGLAARWNLADDFTGPNQLAEPLEAYAQALFNTNQFLFVP